MTPGRLVAGAQALIFDVDGTLAETEETHRRAFNETFADAGLAWHWSREDYKRLLQVTGGKERMRAFDAAGALSDHTIAQLHAAKTQRYVDLVAAGACPLRNGVSALISQARSRGQRLAIATTTSRANVAALLSVTLGPDWDGLFATIVAGDEVRRKKPSPDVYLAALAGLGMSGAESLAVEDSRNGLLSAHAAGIPTVIVRSAYFGDEDFSGAAAVVDEVSDLVA